jgi:molecular chaperone GrpE
MATDETPAGQAGTETPDAALRRERDDLQDRLLRSAAEFDNYRKRTERERREWTEAVTADVFRDLLPVVDDFDRALAAPVDPQAGPDAVARYRDGVDLIRRQMLEVLRRNGVEPIEALGRDFDPEWHEAVATEPANGRRDGEITDEIRRGYRIGTRLLRPAMVKVAKA